MAIKALTPRILMRGARELSDRDADLGRILSNFGPPPMWPREPGFSTLIHIILEQQVSLASAQAAHNRLLAAASPLTPERFLKLNEVKLKQIGFSRQKTKYGYELARAIKTGQLDLDALHSMDDDAVRETLIQIRGIGRWTADVYLLMVLRRPDIWPVGDLALAVAVQHAKRLPTRPSIEELEAIGKAWRPWRAVAARMLWHFYLSGGVKKVRNGSEQD